MYVATFVGVWNILPDPEPDKPEEYDTGVQFRPSYEYARLLLISPAPAPAAPLRPPATNWTLDPPTTARLYCEFTATLPTWVENAVALSVYVSNDVVGVV